MSSRYTRSASRGTRTIIPFMCLSGEWTSCYFSHHFSSHRSLLDELVCDRHTVVNYQCICSRARMATVYME